MALVRGYLFCRVCVKVPFLFSGRGVFGPVEPEESPRSLFCAQQSWGLFERVAGSCHLGTSVSWFAGEGRGGDGRVE